MSGEMAGHVELGLEILDTGYRVTDEQLASLNERGWTSIPDLLTTEVTNLIRSQLSGLKPKDYGGQFASLTLPFAKQFEMKPGDKFTENAAFSVVGHGGVLPKP